MSVDCYLSPLPPPPLPVGFEILNHCLTPPKTGRDTHHPQPVRKLAATTPPSMIVKAGHVSVVDLRAALHVRPGHGRRI